MRRYLVVTPEYGTVIPITDDGQGPTEYECDVYEVEAESARAAKVMAVRHWRSTGARWIRESAGENPFTGLKAEVLEPCEFCGTYCHGCPGLLADDKRRFLEELEQTR